MAILSQTPLIASPKIKIILFLAKIIPQTHLRLPFKITRYHDNAHSVMGSRRYVFSLSVNRLGDFLQKRQWG